MKKSITYNQPPNQLDQFDTAESQLRWEIKADIVNCNWIWHEKKTYNS